MTRFGNGTVYVARINQEAQLQRKMQICLLVSQRQVSDGCGADSVLGPPSFLLVVFIISSSCRVFHRRDEQVCETRACKPQLSHSVLHTHVRSPVVIRTTAQHLGEPLPWQHKCYCVTSIMGWEQGESEVKPHVCLRVCVTFCCHCF